MNPIDPIAVVGSGMVTALGFNAHSTCAAIRAGISGVRQGDIWDPTGLQYMGAARPRLPQWWEGPEVLADMAAAAVFEALSSLPHHIDPASVPIVVLVSAHDRLGREENLAHILATEIRARLAVKPAHDLVVLERGRTGLWLATQYAARVFREQQATHLVIVGTDTFVRQNVVDAYVEERRILTTDNSNGFIPGEAACSVLCTLPARAQGSHLVIDGYGTGIETGTIVSETPLTGDGLTAALREALTQARLGMADTDYWLTDQNAEHYKAKECTIAQIRLERRAQPATVPYAIWHPIEYVGEIGTAIGPCLLGVGFAAARDGYAPGPTALMHVGDDTGERAAFVLRWQS